MLRYIWIILVGIGLFVPEIAQAQIDTTLKPKPKILVKDSLKVIQADTVYRPSDTLFGNAPKFADSIISFDTARTSFIFPDSLIGDSILVDTTLTDTTLKERPHWQKLIFAGPRPPFDPKVAWQRSLIFPGWGQIYNKSYWKVPIVYGGYVALGYWYNLQNQTYQRFRTAYLYRVDGDASTIDTFYPGATDDGVRQARDRARRLRDYAVLYIAGFHLFQVLDAFVDAHLKNFDVSEDLSMNTRPGVIELTAPTGSSQYAVGLTLSFKLQGKGNSYKMQDASD